MDWTRIVFFAVVAAIEYGVVLWVQERRRLRREQRARDRVACPECGTRLRTENGMTFCIVDRAHVNDMSEGALAARWGK